MNINALHRNLVSGEGVSENELFEYLSVSFRLFAQQRIWNEQDSEEIVQDALMTIAKKYREIEFDTSFAAWAYKVLNHKMLDYFKTKKVRADANTRIVDEKLPEMSWKPDPVLKRQLLECLRKIKGRHARILNFHYQGYTTDEICEKLDLKSGNFYVMLSRARSMLELCLEKGAAA
jgi:RNA polymerase sigma-70 factor (ECF subfamily)